MIFTVWHKFCASRCLCSRRGSRAVVLKLMDEMDDDMDFIIEEATAPIRPPGSKPALNFVPPPPATIVSWDPRDPHEALPALQQPGGKAAISLPSGRTTDDTSFTMSGFQLIPRDPASEQHPLDHSMSSDAFLRSSSPPLTGESHTYVAAKLSEQTTEAVDGRAIQLAGAVVRQPESATAGERDCRLRLCGVSTGSVSANSSTGFCAEREEMAPLHRLAIPGSCTAADEASKGRKGTWKGDEC